MTQGGLIGKASQGKRLHKATAKNRNGQALPGVGRPLAHRQDIVPETQEGFLETHLRAPRKRARQSKESGVEEGQHDEENSPPPRLSEESGVEEGQHDEENLPPPPPAPTNNAVVAVHDNKKIGKALSQKGGQRELAKFLNKDGEFIVPQDVVDSAIHLTFHTLARGSVIGTHPVRPSAQLIEKTFEKSLRDSIPPYFDDIDLDSANFESEKGRTVAAEVEKKLGNFRTDFQKPVRTYFKRLYDAQTQSVKTTAFLAKWRTSYDFQRECLRNLARKHLASGRLRNVNFGKLFEKRSFSGAEYYKVPLGALSHAAFCLDLYRLFENSHRVNSVQKDLVCERTLLDEASKLVKESNLPSSDLQKYVRIFLKERLGKPPGGDVRGDRHDPSIGHIPLAEEDETLLAGVEGGSTGADDEYSESDVELDDI